MGDTGLHAIKHAIKVGYRLLDTAHVYRNEELVGRAVRECIEEGTRVVNLKFLMQGQAVLVWNFPNRAILKFSRFWNFPGPFRFIIFAGRATLVWNLLRSGHFGLKFSKARPGYFGMKITLVEPGHFGLKFPRPGCFVLKFYRPGRSSPRIYNPGRNSEIPRRNFYHLQTSLRLPQSQLHFGCS